MLMFTYNQDYRMGLLTLYSVHWFYFLQPLSFYLMSLDDTDQLELI